MGRLREIVGAETAPEIKERLQLLVTAAESKILLFRNDLKERMDSPLYKAGDFIVFEDSGIRADVSGGLDEAVANLAEQVFFNDSNGLKDKIMPVVKKGFNQIFGGGVAGQSEKRQMISFDENATPMALHIYAWRYGFSNESIVGKTDNAFAYLVVKTGMLPQVVTKPTLVAEMASEDSDLLALADGAVEAAQNLASQSVSTFQSKIATMKYRNRPVFPPCRS